MTFDIEKGEKLASKNSKLDRESQGWTSILSLGIIFLFIDVWKQVASYGMRYFNGGTYPLPQTQIVAITELVKFIVFLIVLISRNELTLLKVSLWYAIPSCIFAINNNIYLYALNFVTPPLWAVLIQLRIVITAIVYRVLFKRFITGVQFAALIALMITIACTQLTGTEVDVKTTTMAALLPVVLLAAFGSTLSVFGTVTMEVSLNVIFSFALPMINIFLSFYIFIPKKNNKI